MVDVKTIHKMIGFANQLGDCRFGTQCAVHDPVLRQSQTFPNVAIVVLGYPSSHSRPIVVHVSKEEELKTEGDGVGRKFGNRWFGLALGNIVNDGIAISLFVVFHWRSLFAVTTQPIVPDIGWNPQGLNHHAHNLPIGQIETAEQASMQTEQHDSSPVTLSPREPTKERDNEFHNRRHHGHCLGNVGRRRRRSKENESRQRIVARGKGVRHGVVDCRKLGW
mmetsp:Transcript_10361/g.28613  ORF Transcript_10361/g.28613 Transcript_10361/m.28613 type:complete len:221 (-) Transcript_10361:696-1358(-)